MEDPKLGHNKEQSFIEFSTTESKIKLGKEGDSIFIEINEQKVFMDESISGVDATPVARTNNPIVGASLPNANLDALDSAIGADVAPVVRTNHPVVQNTTVLAKIGALDACIGTDGDIAGVFTRTVGQIVAAATVNAHIKALDDAIGSDAQMPDSSKIVDHDLDIYQNLRALDTYKSVETVKRTIGWDGATGTDFIFAGDANHTAQNIDLGSIVPAKARVTGIEIVCIEAAVGVSDITFRAGNASTGEQFIASASCDDLNEVVGIIDATKPAAVVMNWAAATNIWIGADPSDATWGDMTAGKWAIYVTYINLNNI